MRLLCCQSPVSVPSCDCLAPPAASLSTAFCWSPQGQADFPSPPRRCTRTLRRKLASVIPARAILTLALHADTHTHPIPLGVAHLL